ncbi:MAG: hypothetical protein U0Q18_25710 [Bryobacteraceae bacterium]
MGTTNDRPTMGTGGGSAPRGSLHPAWAAFLKYCMELKYGEIERLSIQDGLPVVAEITKKKVKFLASR